MVINRRTSFGETFGVFDTFDAAILALRNAGRNLNTHTIRRTAVGYIVNHRGY